MAAVRILPSISNIAVYMNNLIYFRPTVEATYQSLLDGVGSSYKQIGDYALHRDTQRKETEFKEVFSKFVDYQQSVHLANQKRIQVGLKVNILLPLVFLVLSFAISSAKLVFLILWIISLFGIAGYLIYVEYSDYKMMQQLEEFGVELEVDKIDRSLLGDSVQQVESIAKDIEERVEHHKEMVAQIIEKQEVEDDEEHI